MSVISLDLGVQVLVVEAEVVSVRGDQGLPCSGHRQCQLILGSFKCTTEQPMDKAQPH